jgi:hypothetical protein
MQSNNHYIWDLASETPANIVAHTLLEQLKGYATEHNLNPRHIKILDKRQLTIRNIRHVDCQINWHSGPDNWAYSIPLKDMPGVCIEAHTGNSLSFYTI